ncbi:hypothetical protein [Leisingera sp. M658]|uniref:hypothetical protein n=1 Tax=Leisingera sp. M658 TaxID=2867015 RepID=UPI0021A4E4E5|nr:hypothetical protein [Leisingera sp. M658]UWQ77375.1 hypothetical protein K3724_22835 [Leisingera sp. M658]
MSYSIIRAELKRLRKSFAQDVFKYLDATGRTDVGRSYFGSKAANNPKLVARLEAGQSPGLEVMLRVWEFMDDNPPKRAGATKDVSSRCPFCGQEMPK